MWVSNSLAPNQKGFLLDMIWVQTVYQQMTKFATSRQRVNLTKVTKGVDLKTSYMQEWFFV